MFKLGFLQKESKGTIWHIGQHCRQLARH